MTDGTRPIFWLNVLLAFAAAILVVLGKWEWVLVVAIAVVILNLVNRINGQGRPKE